MDAAAPSAARGGGEEEDPYVSKAIEDAELAVELLEAEEEGRTAREDWGLYDYLGQEEEDDEVDDSFNLSDSDVAGNMSTDDALAIVRMAQAPLYDAQPYPYKTDRARVLHDLRTSIVAVVAARKQP